MRLVFGVGAAMFAVVLGVATASFSNGVSLLKCCPHGQTLDLSGVCVPYDGGWTPQIYSPTRRGLLPAGEKPSHWNMVEGGRPVCRGNVTATRIEVLPDGLLLFLVFDNGSLWLQESPELVAPGRFCVESSVALVCLDDEISSEDIVHKSAGGGPNSASVTPPLKKARVKKCCGQGGVYSHRVGRCVLGTSPLDASLLGNVTDYVMLSAGFPMCSRDAAADFVIAGQVANRRLGAVLRRDGSFVLADARLTLNPGEYCLEHVVEELHEETTSVFMCADNPHLPTLAPKRSPDDDDLRFTLYPVGLFLSVFFLAATLAAGCLLPPSHHQLHWRCQTYHVACLMVGDLFLAITQVAAHRLSPIVCNGVAILMHFTFLAAFFWLNTMCFNIWWTFRDFRPTSLDKGQEACRLRLYELYAWGGPLLIAGVAAIVDNLPDPGNFLQPRFGQQTCWFYGDVEIFLYFYAPVGLLLLMNVLLFTATARELTCGLWKREVVKSNTERATLGRVCLKLVVVMGLTWVADVVSWAAGGPSYVWYFSDIINTLQGVFIFAVVGCHPQVWAAVKRLWCFREPHRDTAHLENHQSSCSQGLPSMGESTTNTHSTKIVPLETLC